MDDENNGVVNSPEESTETEGSSGSSSGGLLGGGSDPDYTDSLNNIAKYLKSINDKLKKDVNNDIPSSDEVKQHLNTCNSQYRNQHITTYLQEGLTYKANFATNCDLNNDGKITQEDVDLAIENEELKNLSIISVLGGLTTLPNKIETSLSKNQFTNKDMFIKYAAVQIFAYSDWDRNNVTMLLNRAVQNAVLLADKLKFNS